VYLANSVGMAIALLTTMQKIIIPIYGLFHISPIFAECDEVSDFSGLYSDLCFCFVIFPGCWGFVFGVEIVM